MSKLISFSDGARASLLKGVETIAKAVMTTLGPKGRHVLLERSFGAPRITKDGVTVAKDVELEDKFENAGAQLIKDVADKNQTCLLYTSPSPRDRTRSRMPSSA